MKINYENSHRKSPKPLWFRTFLRRYLNRFALLVAGGGLDLRFRLWRKLLCCRHPAGGKRQSTGLSHLDGFESSSASRRKEKSHPGWDDFFFSGCGRRTRTSDLRVMSPTSFQLLYPAILTFPTSLEVDQTGNTSGL